jgi:hypothetical protein
MLTLGELPWFSMLLIFGAGNTITLPEPFLQSSFRTRLDNFSAARACSQSLKLFVLVMVGRKLAVERSLFPDAFVSVLATCGASVGIGGNGNALFLASQLMCPAELWLL